MMTRNSRHA